MPEFHKVARVGDIPAGEMKGVEVNGNEIAIYNVDGEFFATNNICSHEEAYLAEGWLDDDVVTCPSHGAEFCVRTGEALTLPATQPIATYPVKVEGDDVFVGIET